MQKGENSEGAKIYSRPGIFFIGGDHPLRPHPQDRRHCLRYCRVVKAGFFYRLEAFL